MFRFVFFVILAFLTFSARAELIPFTNADLEAYTKLERSERLGYLYDFYKKNKEAGATDGQIINEIIKIKEIHSDPIIGAFSRTSKFVKDFDGYFALVVDDINQGIQERYPNRKDYLIDANDSKTWKNIQYITIGTRDLKSLIATYMKNEFFSDPKYTETGAVMLATCARLDVKNPDLLMGVMVLLNQSSEILMQMNGQKPVGLSVDFSQSENLEFGDLYYPLQNDLSQVDGTGYVKEVTLPFAVKIIDPTKPVIARAIVKADVCRQGVCKTEALPMVELKPLISYLQSSVCTQLEIAKYNVPLNQTAKINVIDAVFKKAKDNSIDLNVVIEKPFFITGLPKFRVQNQDGLLFEKPFSTTDGNKVIYKARVKNPELLQNKNKVPLILTFYTEQQSSQHQMLVEVGEGFVSYAKTTFMGAMTAFANGIIFIVVTPILTALLMLMYQMFNAKKKSAVLTGQFFDGLVKSTWLTVPFYLALFAVFAVIPGKMMYWGVQFGSPWLCFVFAVSFIVAGYVVIKLFNNNYVTHFAKPFEVFFIWFGIEHMREKAGFIAGTMLAASLLITPEIATFYEFYNHILKSPIIYTVFFALAFVVVFASVVLMDKMAEATGHRIKFLKFSMVLPLIVQVLLLLTILGTEAGLISLIGAVVLIGASIALVQKFNRKIMYLVVLIISVAIVPLVPNKYDINQLGVRDFNADEIDVAVKNGKTVYLNVTQSGCLSCQMNRLMMLWRGGNDEIKSGKLIFMGIPYAHPFLQRFYEGTGQYMLPANMIFSPKNPSGKILPAIIGPWRAPDIVRENVIP